MSYKRVRVWDGSTWQQIGAQVPGLVEAQGLDSITLIDGVRTKGISFGDAVFTFTPLVFVQVTGTNHATITVDVDTLGFTVSAKGTGNETIEFNWFAIQANFSA